MTKFEELTDYIEKLDLETGAKLDLLILATEAMQELRRLLKGLYDTNNSSRK